MRFHGIPWGFKRFYDVPVNQSVPTEANRDLTSYSLRDVHYHLAFLSSVPESFRVTCLCIYARRHSVGLQHIHLAQDCAGRRELYERCKR
jgi:hypothetical protein